MENYSIEQLSGHQPIPLSENCPLMPQAAVAFSKMQAEAAREGVTMEIYSGYRSYADQKRIWEGKVKKFAEKAPKPLERVQLILEYSALPGTSRHHFGTELDVATKGSQQLDPLLPELFSNTRGESNKLFLWLVKYAQRYGFRIAYPLDPSRSGFRFEPWHLSYEPVAKTLLGLYLSQDWQKHILAESLSDGAVLTDHFLRRYELEYIRGIHLDLLPT